MHVWRRGMFWTWGIRWAYLSLLSRTWHWPTQHFVLCLPLKNAFRARLPQNWNFQGQAKENSKKASSKKKNTAPGTQSETKVTKSAPATKTVIFTELYILLLCFSDLHRLSWSFLFLTFSDLSFSFFLFPLRFLPFLIFPFLVFPFLTFTILIFPFLSTNSIDSWKMNKTFRICTFLLSLSGLSFPFLYIVFPSICQSHDNYVL